MLYLSSVAALSFKGGSAEPVSLLTALEKRPEEEDQGQKGQAAAQTQKKGQENGGKVFLHYTFNLTRDYVDARAQMCYNDGMGKFFYHVRRFLRYFRRQRYADVDKVVKEDT